MRVLHVLTRDYRRGAETFGVQLHEAMLERGVTSRIVALAPAPTGHASLGLAVLGSSPRGPATLRALRQEARPHHVVVAHGSDTLLASRLALLGSHVPFVYVNIGDPLHWSATTARRLRVAWMLRGAAAVGAVAPSAEARLVAHLGVPRSRVQFTGNGRDSGHYLPPTSGERLAGRQAFGLPDDAPVAVAVAALAPEKRLDVAVDAVASMPGWHLLVVGAGPTAGDLARRAQAKAPGRVLLAGEVEDVRPALHAADVAVLTSATEGLPGALVEAAMCGLPIVATDVGFVADVVADGSGGVLVPVGDPGATARGLATCLRNRDEWGSQSRALAVRRFDSAAVTDRWLGLLDRVTGRASQ